MKQMKRYLWYCMVALFILSLTGCEATEEAPAIPPSETMEMNFTAFGTAQKSAFSNTVADSSNYVIAKFSVSFWALWAALATALPVYSFKTAIKSGTATYDGTNKIWTWSYPFTLLITEYTATLTAEVGGDSTTWAMKIALKSNPTAQFTYFTGKCDNKTTGGWWKIYTADKGAVLLITWSKTGNTVGSLKYTNIIASDSNNGAYIEFASLASTEVYDKYFKIKIMSDPNHPENNGRLYTIEWSSTNVAGHIKWDASKLCWDTNKLNTICP